MKNLVATIIIIYLIASIGGCGGGSSGVGKILPDLGAICGNGIIEKGEQCDEGAKNGYSCEYGDAGCYQCGAACEIVSVGYCGDMIVDTQYGEQCDDGNMLNNDGCSVLCKTGFVKFFGGKHEDAGYYVIQTLDGGYAVAGSRDNDGNGALSAWIIKTDFNGNIQWQNVFKKYKSQLALSISQTSDGGYAVAGYAYVYGSQSSDMLILKLDSIGAVQWQKTFGYSWDDGAYSIEQTADGGYIVGGYAKLSQYSADFCVLKLDAAGETQWQRYYGINDYNFGYTVTKTADGGYVIVGETKLRGEYKWNADVLLVKMDSMGDMQWQRYFGGAANDWGYDVIQSPDGGYVVAANTSSYGAGGSDAWISKLDSSGVYMWDRTYGGSGTEAVHSIQNVTDGGYVFAGVSSSNGVGAYNIWVVRIDENGEELWSRTHGADSFNDSARSIAQTADGGLIITGKTITFGGPSIDLILMRMDSDGNCNSCY